MRKTKTELLTKAAVGYFVKKNFGVNVEIAVIPWGRRRADVMAVDRKGHIVICEVKSCKEDYATDKKWHTYLNFCHQFYFVMCKQTWEKVGSSITNKDAGVMILSPISGFLKVVKNAPKRKLDEKTQRDLILRLAWRNATYSKRNTYRTRVYLDETSGQCKGTKKNQ